jgi:hypothetical protein
MVFRRPRRRANGSNRRCPVNLSAKRGLRRRTNAHRGGRDFRSIGKGKLGITMCGASAADIASVMASPIT